MKKKSLFFVVPTNEGQELNYSETIEGSLEDAKKRGKEIRDGLQKVLRQGSIGCELRNDSATPILYLSGSDDWEKVD